ncbi:MAG: HAMP domain-containing histidine kinase, partial [Anaerolineaceae bacterium]|nr:HAMP domain-containing histidine kinase [Anaerolineaceae bacterium]
SDQHRRNQTADIAHELNTPIHIIRGYLEGISDKIYQPDEEMIELLLEETSLLSRLVEDLRLLSLADAGKLPTHPELVNLNEVFEDIRVSFQGQAHEQNITFTTSGSSDVFIKADPSHIYRIINNLVPNARSNTPSEGIITLAASTREEFVVLNVSDTGNGMEPADLEQIFDRFWRKDKSRQRKDGGGYGLGLSIVQQLVKSNNGAITVESTLGVGTTFTLTFARFQALHPDNH